MSNLINEQASANEQAKESKKIAAIAKAKKGAPIEESAKAKKLAAIKGAKASAKKGAPIKSAKKAAPKSAPIIRRGEGVIASIAAFLISSKAPQSKQQILSMLCKKFKERESSAMSATINAQLPLRMGRERNLNIMRSPNGAFYIAPNKSKSAKKESAKKESAKKES